MSFAKKAAKKIAKAVSRVAKSAAKVVGNVVSAIKENPLKAAALVAAAYFAGPSFAIGDAAAAESAAATAASVDTFATVAPETLAAFGPTSGSTLGFFNSASAAAVNTSVADYAAAAAAGTSTGAAAAFTSALPLASTAAPIASAGFLDTALSVAKGVKKAVDTIQIVNAATMQKSLVPANAPIPAGWAVDARWNPSLGDTGTKFTYDPATGALMQLNTQKADQGAQSTAQPSVVAPSGPLSPGLVLAAAAAAVLYLVKS